MVRISRRVVWIRLLLRVLLVCRFFFFMLSLVRIGFGLNLSFLVRLGLGRLFLGLVSFCFLLEYSLFRIRIVVFLLLIVGGVFVAILG